MWRLLFKKSKENRLLKLLTKNFFICYTNIGEDMKKFFICIFTLFIFNISVNAIDIEITSKEAIIYNLNDDKVIYEKNSNEQTKIASLTKIMTCLVALDNINNIDDTVTVDYKDLQGLQGYAVAGFKAGDTVTYKDLLYALMLPSAADAANILSRNIAGSVDDFVTLMNEKVSNLGLKNTHFSNPIGIDDDNYSTAYDMAIVLKEAIKSDLFKQLYNTDSYTTSNNIKLTKTTDKIASKYNLDISNLNGSKTGFTDEAGYCLASTATYNDVNYLAITLNSEKLPNHIKDTLELYNYFNDNYSYKEILKDKQLLKTIKVKDSKTKEYKIISNKTITKYLSNDVDINKIEYKYSGVDTLNRKIKKGDYLGKVKIMHGNDTLDTYKVYLDKDIKYYNYWLLLIPVGILVFIIWIKIKLKKSKRRIKNPLRKRKKR